uniref:Peptidase S74 domain-containing protein n=1 Tax=viral metagenome TaxID=1070528 RepID=A0A6C0K870_9ZZZZ
MALSQTSLQLDTLTVVTLYNRGSFLSTGLSYVPVVSSYGTFYKWTNKPTGQLFVNVFYTYSNGDIFFSSISSIYKEYNITSSSLYFNTDTLLSSIASNSSNTNIINNIRTSTFNSYFLSLDYNSTIVSQYYSSISRSYSSITPGVSTTVNKIYNNLFSPNASTLIQAGIYRYIPRERIPEFTSSIHNPEPLLQGIFGDNSNAPVKWFWQGQASGYVGPGLSSIVDYLITDPVYSYINVIYLDILFNIDTGLQSSNVSLDAYRNNIINTMLNANNYIDGGSSISTLYLREYNSTINSTLRYASTFGSSFSTSYKQLTYNISTFSLPTLGTFRIGQYISTGNSSLNMYQNMSNNNLYSTMSNSTILLNPLNVMSSIVISSVSTSLTALSNADYLPGFYKISSIFNSIIASFSKSLEVSTNYNGYLGLSTYENTVFSTFSTNLTYELGKKLLDPLSTLSYNLSTFSTIITTYNNDLLSVPVRYITAPGISSFQSDLSTNTRVTYIDYSNKISSILFTFSTGVSLVYATPGLSSLSSYVYSYTPTSVNNYNTTNTYVTTGFESEISTVYSVINTVTDTISTNLTNYISAGITAYNNLESIYTQLSTNTLFSLIRQINYISSQTSLTNLGVPVGYLYNYISSVNTLAPIFLDKLDPFYGSTVYYNMLTIIPNYSTTLYTPQNLITPTYILISTKFVSLDTQYINSSASSFTIDTLTLQTLQTSSFVLNMYGSLSLQPFTSDNSGIPNMDLPNFQVYNNSLTLLANSQQNITTQPSTISFNMSNLTIKKLYLAIPFSYIGINTISPEYSLDIAIGDARKPSGTSWITASDERVKERISSISLDEAIKKISSLRLVSYVWDEPYRLEHMLSKERTLGFISQEVQNIFPESVTSKEENGFPDFKSLDVDQIYKAKYAVTRYLIQKVSSLQMRITNLMKS